MSDIETIKAYRDEVERGDFDCDLEDMAHAYVKHVDALLRDVVAGEAENAKLRADKAVLLDRVVAFVGQLQAWGYDAAAVEIYAEIVSGPVIAPDYYALQAENAKLRAVAAAESLRGLNDTRNK